MACQIENDVFYVTLLSMLTVRRDILAAQDMFLGIRAIRNIFNATRRIKTI